MADNPATEILDATYRALCEHGYANRTPQDVTTEAEKRKGSIHYHYDSNDQLFVAFLNELYERFTDRVDSHDSAAPCEQLGAFLQFLLPTDADSSLRAFGIAMLDDSTGPVQFDSTGTPHRLRRVPDRTVTRNTHGWRGRQRVQRRHRDSHDEKYLSTTITGAHTRHVAINHSSDQLYDTMTRHIERHLLADKQPEVAQ